MLLVYCCSLCVVVDCGCCFWSLLWGCVLSVLCCVCYVGCVWLLRDMIVVVGYQWLVHCVMLCVVVCRWLLIRMVDVAVLIMNVVVVVCDC